MNVDPPLDPITVAITFATLLFGPQLAAVIGPYAVILLGAVIGSAWSATRRPPGSSRVGTALYVFLFTALALLVTVPLAQALSNAYPKVEARWLMGPLAVFVAGVGDDWPALLVWCWRNRPWSGRPPAVGTPPADPPQPPGGPL